MCAVRRRIEDRFYDARPVVEAIAEAVGNDLRPGP